MIFYLGDLVKIKRTGTKALVRERSGRSYTLWHVTAERAAWYDRDELILLERGLFPKLFDGETVKKFEAAWGGKVKFFD